MDYREILQVLNNSLPPVFRRKDLDKLTGGVITEGLLKALPPDSPQPPCARLGKFVVYEKAKFLTWAEDYYGRFAEYDTPGFPGRKIRRTTDAKGKAGSGGKGN